MCAYGKKQKSVGKEFVLAAIDDTESVSRPSWFSWPLRSAAAILAGVALAAVLIGSNLIVSGNLAGSNSAILTIDAQAKAERV